MSGKNPVPTPLAYSGVQAVNPPDLIKATRAPTSSDKKAIGTLWLNTSTQTAYQLAGYSAGAPVWVSLGASTGSFTSISASGSIAAGTTLAAGTTVTGGTGVIATTGNLTASNGNLSLDTAGNKVIIATGSNASVGTSAAMTAGVVTVATTASSSTALIFYSRKVTGGTAGNVSITAQDGTGFTLTSTSATETSTFNWWIINA